jgi:hypothetical protein
MKMSYVRLVFGVALLTVIALASCELFGEEEGVSRDERRDTFLAQIKAGQYDRLNGNMHPDAREASANTADYWTTLLAPDSASDWEFDVISTTEVKITAGSTSIDGETFTFTYGSSNDDYFFLTIAVSGATGQIAPPN